MKKLIALLILLFACPALAASGSTPAVKAGQCGATGFPTCTVAGTFSATLAGFTPNGTTAGPLNVTNAANIRVALPTGLVAAVSNVGSKVAYVKLGNSGVNSSTAGIAIQPGTTIGLTVGANTYIGAITGGTDTTTLNIAGGDGLVTGYGGGSSGSSGGNVNVSQVNGTTTSTGNGATDAGTQRVTISSDSTGTVAATISGTVTTNSTIVGPIGQNPMGSSVSVAIANNQSAVPVTSGVADGTTSSGATGSKVQGVVALTTPDMSANAGKLYAPTLDTAQNLRVAGSVPSGTAVAGNPLLNGCRASTTVPTAVSDTQAVALQCSVEGKQIVLPWSVKDLWVRGSVSTSGSAAVTLVAANVSYKIYVTGVQCYRTDAGTTTQSVLLNDTTSTGTSTSLPLPVGGGSNAAYSPPLIVNTVNQALTATPSAALGNTVCSAQGYYGP